MTNNTQELFEKNKAFAHYIVNKYYSKYMFDDDITQSALIGLWKAALKFEEQKGAFASFAYVVIRNEINKELRKLIHYRTRNSLCSDVECTVINTFASNTDIATEVQFAIDTERALAILNEREKRITGMKLLGLGQREIAKKIGLSQPGVSKALRKIRLKIIER